MPYPAQIQPERLGQQALEVVEARGWERWSLRDVSSSLGVSVNALYRYIGDRDGLVVAIGAAAAAALGAALRDLPGDLSGEDRLIALAERYVRFAVERPHAFSAFSQSKPAPDHPAIGAWLVLWQQLREQVAAVLPGDPEAATFGLWALVHGRAELARGPARLAGPTDGLADAVRAMLRGYAAMGPLPSPVPPELARLHR